MTNANGHRVFVTALTVILFLTRSSAFALRCAGKLVLEKMYDAAALRACGSPTTSQQIGYTTRALTFPYVEAPRLESPSNTFPDTVNTPNRSYWPSTSVTSDLKNWCSGCCSP